jgi:hypothetical protein
MGRSPEKAAPARSGRSFDYMAARGAHRVTFFTVDTRQRALVLKRNFRLPAAIPSGACGKFLRSLIYIQIEKIEAKCGEPAY